MKKILTMSLLSSLLASPSVFAIHPSYQDQISCKNWRLKLNEPMQFPQFTNTAAFKQEFKQTKSSDDDEGDYMIDIFKPRQSQQLYSAQIRNVTSDAGYGGDWTSAGFTVEMNGQLSSILNQAQSNLKLNQWSQITRKIEQYNDAGTLIKSGKTTEYYTMQLYPRQARLVRISKDPFSGMVNFGCRAIEGDIKQFLTDFKTF